MAYRIEKKPVADLSGRKAVGVKLPFTTVFIPTYQTLDAYKTNLINFLLTDRGERYFNPEFGSDIRALLFEPNNLNSYGESFKSNLIRKINIYFPRLVIDNIEIDSTSEHTVQIYLKFHIKDSRLSDELVVNFE